MKLRKKILFALGLSICLLAGCSDKNPVDGGTVTPTEKPTVTATATPTATPTTKPTITPTSTPIVTATPTAIPTPTKRPEEIEFVGGYLNGNTVYKKHWYGRPIAVMFNNLKASCPQAGLKGAQVVYEAPIEGGITQLMGLYENYSNFSQFEKLGSVGSGRVYFMDYAASFDAIYVHDGESEDVNSTLESAQVDKLSSMSGVGIDAFQRVDDKQAPNNVYTSGESIQKAIELGKYRMDYKEDYVPCYTFSEGRKDIYLMNATSAYRVYPGYSYTNPWFEYNAEDGLYYRYQFGEKLTDELEASQEQSWLVDKSGYKNIIFEYTSWSYADEESGTLKLNTYGKNKGKYITNRAAIDITWERDKNGTVQYKDMDGNPLVINWGSTWVCVILDTEADKVKFETSR